MKRAILISVKPKDVVKILNEEKTIEIRKTAPKCDLPIQVYIYCTKGGDMLYAPNGYNEHYWIQKHGPLKRDLRGKVVAKFRLSQIVEIDEVEDWIANNSCVSKEHIENYRGDGSAYAWFISDLKIFDEPKPLSDFGLKRAPQSWQYVEVEQR